jgi:streptogramin lyase
LIYSEEICDKEKRVVDMLRIFGLLLLIFLVSGVACGAVPAPTELTGIVSSDAEPRMEGVVVSAKRIGGKITVSVMSNQEGRYAFPGDRLIGGGYEIRIRATGYQAENSRMVVTLTGKGAAELNIKLVKAEDLASQLTSAEWLMSIPGTQAQKEKLYRDCVLCHTLTPILASTYNAEEWKTTLVRMWNWSEGGSLQKPLPAPLHSGPRAGDEEFGRYLSSINLSASPKHNFELKTLPRPHGDDTKVIITEYDLPRTDAEPHEAASGNDGMVWYTDEAEGILGRLDPKTGATKEWQDPSAKAGYPGGFHDMELDHDGNAWMGRHEYNGVANFDKKTEKFTNYTIPNVSPSTRPTFIAIRPDGKIWLKDNSDFKIIKFDPKTNEYTPYEEYPMELHLMSEQPATVEGTRSGQVHHSIYGMNTDSQGNAYGADIGVGNLIKVDAETGKTSMYPTPTPNSGPRRMHVDSMDRVWIGEWWANQLAVFDPKTEKFQEWPVPILWYGPYDAVLDKNGNVWTGSMSVDTILRFTPKTGAFRQYLMPRTAVNVRRIDVDNHGKSPVFWVGENRQAKIAKIEPLD